VDVSDVDLGLSRLLRDLSQCTLLAIQLYCYCLFFVDESENQTLA